LNEQINRLRTRLIKLEDKIIDLDAHLRKNDEVVWEMMSNILSALRNEGILVKNHIRAKYDKHQKKLEN